jgi:hypothetical protein
VDAETFGDRERDGIQIIAAISKTAPQQATNVRIVRMYSISPREEKRRNHS